MAVFPSDSIRTKNWGSEILTDSDLETQLDLLHSYFQAALNATTGHAHTGASNQGPKISPANLLIASQTTGDLLYASSTTAWSRLAKGTASQILAMKSDASIPEWAAFSTFNTAANALAGSVVQVVNVITTGVVNCTTALPTDDTIPQNTEGDEVMTLAITPKSATNKLRIDVVIMGQGAVYGSGFALFQDSTVGALAANVQCTYNYNMFTTGFTHYMTAGTTSATTFKVRCGSVFFNGSASSTRYFGGVAASSITITEVKV